MGYLEAQAAASRGGDVVPSKVDAGSLTGISVLYNQQIRAPKVRMTRTGRAAARKGLKPFGMSNSKRPIRPSDPAQNNVNDVGAKIIPPGQGIM